MHCNHCGTLLQSGDAFCPGCGHAVTPTAPPLSRTGPPAAPMYIASGHPSGKATASLICGIFSFFLPAALCAVILGHIALSEIKKSAGRLIGEGRAIAGLVLGYMGLAAIPFILIIAAIAIPNLLRARIAANEASAVRSIRTINVAEVTYQGAYPNVGYACSLSQLGGKGSNPNSTAAGLIDARLTSGTKSGYAFRITGCTVSDDKFVTYQLIATPLASNQSGVRTFCSDQTGDVRYVRGGPGRDCLESGAPLE